jgi:hypothetical protein
MFGEKPTQASCVLFSVQTPREISAKHRIHKKKKDISSSTFYSQPQSPLRSCTQ